MKFAKLTGILALSGAALIWGLSFSAQRDAMKAMEPAVFNACRSFVGWGVLLLFIILQRLFSARKDQCCQCRDKSIFFWLLLLLGGCCCGLMMATGSILQQMGLQTVSAGKAGFLSALYVIMVPVLGIFLRRKTSLLLWTAVIFSCLGAYLLCQPEVGTISHGDLLILVSACFFALHILVIDFFVAKIDVLYLSAAQVFVNGSLSLAVGLYYGETLNLQLFRQTLAPILFCGIGSTGIAYTLQIFGQKLVHPTAASLLLCLESVFAALGGWFILHERLETREIIGCTIILVSVIMAQLPTSKNSTKA